MPLHPARGAFPEPALAPATEEELSQEDASGPALELPIEPALPLPSEEFVFTLTP